MARLDARLVWEDSTQEWAGITQHNQRHPLGNPTPYPNAQPGDRIVLTHDAATQKWLPSLVRAAPPSQPLQYPDGVGYTTLDAEEIRTKPIYGPHYVHLQQWAFEVQAPWMYSLVTTRRLPELLRIAEYLQSDPKASLTEKQRASLQTAIDLARKDGENGVTLLVDAFVALHLLTNAYQLLGLRAKTQTKFIHDKQFHPAELLVKEHDAKRAVATLPSYNVKYRLGHDWFTCAYLTKDGKQTLYTALENVDGEHVPVCSPSAVDYMKKHIRSTDSGNQVLATELGKAIRRYNCRPQWSEWMSSEPVS